MNFITFKLVKTLGIKQTESQWLGVLWQIKKNTLIGIIGIVGIENWLNQKNNNTLINFYTYNVNVKTLPISFYAFQLSASAWFRKKFCGKINVVFKIKVVAVVTIASNGWLCVCWGFKSSVFSALLINSKTRFNVYLPQLPQ